MNTTQHALHSTITDAGIAGEVEPSHWNAPHLLPGEQNGVLYVQNDAPGTIIADKSLLTFNGNVFSVWGTYAFIGTAVPRRALLVVQNNGRMNSLTLTDGQIPIGVSGVLPIAGSISAGVGISVIVGPGSILVANSGVRFITPGPGIGVSGGAGEITVSNTGVRSILAGTGISIDHATGDVTITSTATGMGGSADAGQVTFWTSTSTTGGSPSFTWDDTLENFVAQPVWVGHPALVADVTQSAILGSFQCVLDGTTSGVTAGGMLGCQSSTIMTGGYASAIAGSGDGVIASDAYAAGMLGTSTSKIYGGAYQAVIGCSNGFLGGTVLTGGPPYPFTPDQPCYYAALSGCSYAWMNNCTYAFIGGASFSAMVDATYAGMVGVSDCYINGGTYCGIFGSSSSVIGTANYCAIVGGNSASIGDSADSCLASGFVTIGANCYNSVALGYGTIEDGGSGMVVGGGTIQANKYGVVVSTFTNPGTIAHTGAIVIGKGTSFDNDSLLLSATTVAVRSIGLGAPAALVDGMWWVEAAGIAPAAVIALKVRRGGITYTLASIAY